MENEITKSEIISNLFWKMLQSLGSQGASFIVQIVLARLLLPKDYGMVALIIVFINLANVFIQSSFNKSLIQRKNANEIDFSSVFYLNLVIAGFLYTAIFFAGPSIAEFYKEPVLVPLMRFMAVTLFIGALNSVQQALIARRMQFKKLFISNVCAIITAGAIGIIMAYSGFGVWALAVYQITNQLLITLILWFTVKWRPQLVFSLSRIRSLFSFGWKVLLSTLIDVLYDNLLSLLVGKIYSVRDLGFYQRGVAFPLIIVVNVNDSIQSVMFPALSYHQDDIQRVIKMLRRSIATATFLIFPMMAGLAAVAEPLVLILLTEKWLPAVPLLQAYCLTCAMIPIHSANIQAINAIGRSDVTLKLEIIKKIVGILILTVTIQVNILVVVIGTAVARLAFTFINAYSNKKLLHYSYYEQWKDVIPSLLLSLTMGTLVYSFSMLDLKTWLLLLIQIITGVIFYCSVAWLFKLEAFTYLIDTVNKIVKK